MLVVEVGRCGETSLHLWPFHRSASGRVPPGASYWPTARQNLAVVHETAASELAPALRGSGVARTFQLGGDAGAGDAPISAPVSRAVVARVAVSLRMPVGAFVRRIDT